MVCKSLDQINDILKGGYLEAYYIDTFVNIADYQQPLKNYFGNYYVTTDPASHKFIELFFQKVDVVTDDGILFQNIYNYTDIKYECTREQFDVFSASEKFMDIYIKSSNNHYVVNRTYLKLQDVAANVGGMVSFMITIGYILTNQLNTYTMNEIIINTLFDFFEREEIKREKSIVETNYNKSNSFIEPVKIAISKPPICNNFLNSQDNCNISTKKDINDSRINKALTRIAKIKEKSFRLQLNFGEKLKYLLFIFKCNIHTTNDKKMKMFELAKCEMFKYMDYLQIVRLLQEFHKLKNIFLTNDQKKLFNFFSKPKFDSNFKLKYSSRIPLFEHEELNVEELYKAYLNVKDGHDLFDKKVLENFEIFAT